MGNTSSKSRKWPADGSFQAAASSPGSDSPSSHKWSPRSIRSPLRKSKPEKSPDLQKPILAESGSFDIKPCFDDDGEYQHHSIRHIPVVSPKFAAIEARTLAAAQAEEAIAMERSESRPPQRGPAAVAARRRAAAAAAAGLDSLGQPKHGDPFGLSEHWLINREDITIGKTIGHSSFGSVNEGHFNGTKVAVKTIKRNPNAKGGQDFDVIAKEAELNCKLRHPNIVLFMGIAMMPDEVCIVTELMARGNVHDLLVANSKGKQVKLELSLRMQWALDTAQGMAYLHSLSPPMIHRDLKTTNLLVDRGMNVKICDFGLSRFQAEDKVMTAVGTVQFAAPEVLKHEKYTEKVDLFSYGTVMWELYTRKPAFDGMPQLQVYKAVVEGDMPGVDDQCCTKYRQIMHECWLLDPEKRPSFRQIIPRLSELIDTEE